MRLAQFALLALLAQVPASYGADESGDRSHPADDNAACLDRSVSSGTGGCITREDGSARDVPPRTLGPEPDTTRQSPPASEGTPPTELPVTGPTAGQ